LGHWAIAVVEAATTKLARASFITDRTWNSFASRRAFRRAKQYREPQAPSRNEMADSRPEYRMRRQR
jgi:hypothetical protein